MRRHAAGRGWRRSLICGRERCGGQTQHGGVGRSWPKWVSQLPPLIKPDGRISRIWLSENLRRKAIGVASASVRSSPAGLCYDGKKCPPPERRPDPKARGATSRTGSGGPANAHPTFPDLAGEPGAVGISDSKTSNLVSFCLLRRCLPWQWRRRWWLQARRQEPG